MYIGHKTVISTPPSRFTESSDKFPRYSKRGHGEAIIPNELVDRILPSSMDYTELSEDPEDDRELRIEWNKQMDKADACRRRIEELGEMHKICLKYRYCDYMSYKEIASELGVSINSVKTWIRKGRLALTAKTKEDFVTIEDSEYFFNALS